MISAIIKRGTTVALEVPNHYKHGCVPVSIMPPKRPRNNAGRGRPKHTFYPYHVHAHPLSPSSSHHSGDDSNTHFTDDEGQRRPLSDSNASSLVTVLATAATVAASLESTSSEDPDDMRKRARKDPFC